MLRFWWKISDTARTSLGHNQPIHMYTGVFENSPPPSVGLWNQIKEFWVTVNKAKEEKCLKLFVKVFMRGGGMCFWKLCHPAHAKLGFCLCYTCTTTVFIMTVDQASTLSIISDLMIIYFQFCFIIFIIYIYGQRFHNMMHTVLYQPYTTLSTEFQDKPQ